MKVTFYSNFLNHHQLPFCLDMYKRLGKDFKFVATERIHEERLAMGYEDMSEQYPFSLNVYENIENFEEALKLGEESDVVIIGSASDVFIMERLRQNKLTFRYSERIFKKGRYRLLNPRVFISLLKNHTRYRNGNLYMLCASAFTAGDFYLVGAYKKKTFKWGYFPELKSYDWEELKKKKDKSIPKLLWVGRLLELKRPADAIEAAYMLKQEGYKFQLDIIGSGHLEEKLMRLIKKYNISHSVALHGSMSPEEVRSYMESADIFLFTSDFNEGWGAVLNESMNSGCAVVASHAIGSVPFLIHNQKNGLIYKSGNVEDLYKCIKTLMDDDKLCKRLGMEAYKTLKELWNAELATKRLIQLSEALLKGKELQFKSGPCSRAEVISQKYH